MKVPRSRLAACLVLALLAGPALAGRARAQTAVRDQVEASLHFTERVLQQADASLASCQSSRQDAARKLLDTGKDRYAVAVQFFNTGRFLRAGDQAEKARELANRAIRLCEASQGLDLQVSLVRAELDRTDQLLSQVRESVRESGNDRAQIVFDGATTKQLNARASFNDATSGDKAQASKLERALKLTRDSRSDAQRAMDLLGGDRSFNPDRIREELRHTDEQIATATEWVESSPGGAGQEAIDAARLLEERARRMFDSRQFPEALSASLRARDMIDQVLNGPEAVNPQDVDHALLLAEDALNRARSAPLSAAGARLRDQAELRYNRALQEKEGGHLKLALLIARASLNLANRALTSP
jgi:hypothetical protein